MKIENLHFSSKTIELAETDTALQLRSRLCYYGDVNMNSVKLPEVNAEEYAQTLINMPVQAKVKHNVFTDQDTFGGHEVVVNPITQEVTFDTESIGVHTSVEIRDDLVETVSGEYKTLPCLFANYIIWKRYPKVIEVVKRLHSEDRLYSSWEIETDEYTYSEGIKELTKYRFIGNCLLGDGVTPAYGSIAKSVSMSEKVSNESPELLIAEALILDINNNKEEVDNLKDVEKKTEISEEEVKVEEVNTSEDETVEEVNADAETETNESEKEVESVESEEENVETEEAPQNEEIQAEDTNDSEENADKKDIDTSALTVEDLYQKIARAAEEKLDSWCYVAHLFPNEKTVWVKSGDSESDLDYVLFTYSVIDDQVQLSEPQKVKLTVSISSINDKVNELNESIVSSNETIQNLNAEISTLSVFKEKFEKAEQERIEAEQAEKIESLKRYAMKSGLISEEEVNASDTEISTMISELNESAIKAVIAERFMDSLKTEKTVETSEKKETKNQEVKVNLSTKGSLDDAVSEFKQLYVKKN